jgi:hypothetical protein
LFLVGIIVTLVCAIVIAYPVCKDERMQALNKAGKVRGPTSLLEANLPATSSQRSPQVSQSAMGQKNM